jgi:hypothetical protein
MLKLMAMPFLRPLQPALHSFQEGLRRTPPLVFAMAVLSAGLIGASTERIRSDFVDWSVEVKQSAPSQPLAYQQLQPAVAQTTAFLIATISREIGELIGQGVPLTINAPAFTYTKLADKRVDMLAKATRDARRRALAIAAEAGASSYDTRTIDKDITAVMAVTFRVQ